MKKPVLITLLVMIVLAVVSIIVFSTMGKDQNQNLKIDWQPNQNTQESDVNSQETKVSFPEYYKDELPVLGVLTPITENEYSLVFKSSTTASSTKPLSAITLQLQTSLPIFSPGETSDIVTNNCTDAGWSPLFNKQSTEGNTSFLRFGSVIMPGEGLPDAKCSFFDEKNPQLTIKTEFPIIATDFKGLLELIYADGKETMGKIVINSNN